MTTIAAVPLPDRPWKPRGPLVLLFLALAFIAFALPPYLSLDPGRSRIPPPPGLRAYYPLLVLHVSFASVAMVLAPLQIWPWLRRRYPAVHRRLGRVYVLGGVLPAGLAGLLIGAVSPFGPVIRASNVLLALLWLTATGAGLRAVLRGRYEEHRRWMIRSVTLTLSIITNRVWGVLWTIVFIPQLGTTFGGSEAAMVQAIAGLSGWLGWVVPLVVVEWWVLKPSIDSRPVVL